MAQNYNGPDMDRSGDWLAQAKDDLLWARATIDADRFAQACFVCQQVAEKGLKALAIYRGFDEIRSHSILEIAEAMGLNAEIESMGKRLDQYYIGPRYPDAFASGAPFKYFTKDQADEAMTMAERLVAIVETEMVPRDGS